MNFDLLKTDPLLFFVILIVNLLVTVLAYGAFPFVFAKTRKTFVSKKKYKSLCFGINAIVLFLFVIFNDGILHIGPYVLWTSLISNFGVKELCWRGVMSEEGYLKKDPNRITECKSCGYRSVGFFNACPKCGNYAKQYIYLADETKSGENKILFCRKCGEKLYEGSRFCGKCGTEIMEE